MPGNILPMRDGMFVSSTPGIAEMYLHSLMNCLAAISWHNGSMTDHKDIDAAAMKTRLMEMRDELERLARAHEHDSDTVELDQMVQGRRSRMDALQGQAMAQEVARRRERELRRIDGALKRLEDGEYGWCAGCGEEIAAKRLELDPTVPTCIDCASSG